MQIKDNLVIKEIFFERNDDGQVIFNPQNIELLAKNVIPIVEKNEGWGSKDLTLEKFFGDPNSIRGEIDATVQSSNNSGVHIAYLNSHPVGLLEYIEVDIFNEEKKSDQIIVEMINNINSKYWKFLIDSNLLEKPILDDLHSKLLPFFKIKKYYKDIGVVLRSDLQGQKSGISDKLYEIMKPGIVFGYTSSPLVLAKRRKVFDHTYYFPFINEKGDSIESLAALALSVGALFNVEDSEWKPYKFGVRKYKHFVKRDKNEYIELSKQFLAKNKITLDDFEKLSYILDNFQTAGIVVSFS